MRRGTNHCAETRDLMSRKQKLAWEKRRAEGRVSPTPEQREQAKRAAILKWQKLAIAMKALKKLGM